MVRKLLSNVNWLLLVGMILLITIATGALTFYFNYQEQKSFKIDPKVQLDSKTEYEITYWDYPIFIGQEKEYKIFLKQAISEFNDMYPNVKINYKLLSFVEGRDKLKDKLEAGDPPDIYHGIFGNKLLDKKLQIPVSIFFNQEKNSNGEKYNKVGLKAFTYNQKLWGLPNWIQPQVWVGNQNLLIKTDLAVDQIEKNGWKRQDFKQAAKEIVDLGRDSSIVFNPYNSKLVYQLLSADNKDRLVTSKGTLAFTAKDLRLVFEFLDELRSNDVFPNKSKEMNKKLVPNLWRQKAGVIAPVNIWLLNNFYQRVKQESDINLTLLPPPTYNSQLNGVPIDVTGLLLFRQQEYKGDAHTKAVYKFAKFLNQQKNLFIAKKLKVIPAYLPLESLWRKEVNLKEKLKQQLLKYSNQGVVNSPSGFENMEREAEIKDIINENYQNFWEGKNSVSTVVDKIMVKSKQIVNENNTKK